MGAATFKRLGFSLLAAALATGCAPLRGSGPGSLFGIGNVLPTADPTAGRADTIPGGTVVAAGGTAQPPAPIPTVPTMQPPVASGPAVPPTPPGPIAMPRPLPAAPGAPNPTNPQPQLPVEVPGAPQLPSKFDPHVRNTPTAAGGRLTLAPYEVPTDRVVELTLHLERLLGENHNLQARIKELEVAALGREQALAEAMREVEATAADAARTRAALQSQIVTLQGKIKQMEEEDVVFLKAVIEALGRLFPPEKKP